MRKVQGEPVLILYSPLIVVPLVFICKWTWTITMTIVVCIYMQYFYHGNEPQGQYKYGPWGF